MSHKTSGQLLISAISGDTQYLTPSELEHARQVLRSLMGVAFDSTPPPLRFACLQGDAAFSYGFAGGRWAVTRWWRTRHDFRPPR